MKRMKKWRSRGRSYRNAAFKQQLLRKEAQKRSKYPICAVYGHTLRVRQTRPRGM